MFKKFATLSVDYYRYRRMFHQLPREMKEAEMQALDDFIDYFF